MLKILADYDISDLVYRADKCMVAQVRKNETILTYIF